MRVTHILIGCLPPTFVSSNNYTGTQQTDHDTITFSEDAMSHVRDKSQSQAKENALYIMLKAIRSEQSNTTTSCCHRDRKMTDSGG